MAKIYRTTDRLPIRIDDITIKISPLKADQKAEIESHMRGEKLSERVRGITLAIKYAVKEIEGVEDIEGNPYKLELEGDSLTDACVDDLLNLDVKDKLSLVCASFVRDVPKAFGIEGVEYVDKSDVKKK